MTRNACEIFPLWVCHSILFVPLVGPEHYYESHSQLHPVSQHFTVEAVFSTIVSEYLSVVKSAYFTLTSIVCMPSFIPPHNGLVQRSFRIVTIFYFKDTDNYLQLLK